MLLAGPAPAGEQTFPGQNGRLAYNRGGTVYTANSNGTDERAVAGPTQFSAGDPSWSPDGRRLAFQSATSTGGVWTIGADGTAPRRVTTDLNDRYATWSPDGRRIAFVRFQDRYYRLFYVNVDGTGLTLVTGAINISVEAPEWSPDGTRFAFSDGARIYVVNVDGTGLRQLTGVESGNARYPTWSPDGTRIAFATLAGSGTIRVVPAAGGTPSILVGNVGEPWDVSWSPDGTKLAFVADVIGPFQEELWTVNADGSGLTRLNLDSNVSVAWGVLAAVAPPVAGVSVNAAPVSGVVRVRVRGTNRFVNLSSLRNVPVGSEFDVTRGRVRLVSAAGGNRRQTGVFYSGRAIVRQPRARLPVTTLELSGPLACRRTSGAGAAAPVRKRRLWGNGKGRFRTRGRFASAAVRGTTWLTEDRCDGTFVRVTVGRVEVFDQVRGRRVTVRAGQSYLARARR